MKKYILFPVFLLILFGTVQASDKSTNSNYATTPWSVRMVNSEMSRKAASTLTWDYTVGTLCKGVEETWRIYRDTTHYTYIKNIIDKVVSSSGSITGYSLSSYTLDNIREASAVLFIYNQTKTAKYKTACDNVRKQFCTHPRVSEGGFWHKQTYPNQMWLDGLYMGEPFYAEYGAVFPDSARWDDVTRQFTIIERHARDSVSSLLYHGWDAGKTQSWANPVTGCSKSFWGRADGWYAMALVDVLDYIPAGNTDRDSLINILKRLAVGIKKCQDPKTGAWFQVLDKGDSTGNYVESSASCCFVYALAKGVRMGYIDASYLNVARTGHDALIDQFITTNTDSTITLNKICLTAGLGDASSTTSPGTTRDGSYNYYVNVTTLTTNDAKGTGPFILASEEIEKSGYVRKPDAFAVKVNTDSTVQVTWTDKSYNGLSFIIERKKSTDANYSVVGTISRGIATYNDKSALKGSKYTYRMRAKADTAYSAYTAETEVTIPGVTAIGDETVKASGFALSQNYPNPFNPSTTIQYEIPNTLMGAQMVTLKAYNAQGQEVATLVNKEQSAGMYQIVFNAAQLPSGIYAYTLHVGSFSSTRKMLLLK
jgi:unsaturated rhamnogalacturonyl hydrolase